MEELTTKTTEGSALEVKEYVDNVIKICLELAELGGIKIDIKISGFIILFHKFEVQNIANQVFI